MEAIEYFAYCLELWDQIWDPSWNIEPEFYRQKYIEFFGMRLCNR